MSGSSGTGTTAGRRVSTRTWPPIRRTPASSRSSTGSTTRSTTSPTSTRATGRWRRSTSRRRPRRRRFEWARTRLTCLSTRAGSARRGPTPSSRRTARTRSSTTPRARTPTTSAARCTSGEAPARGSVATTLATPRSGCISRPFCCRTSRPPPRRPYAWLAFQGRWGQKERGINNGPTGPAAKEQWLAPIEWADGLRETSIEVPSGTAFGLSVGNFFCGAVSDGAIALNWSLIHPVPFVALVLLSLVGLLAAVATTTWRPPDPHPLATAAPGWSDLPGDDAHLRREHPDIRGGGRDLRSCVRRRRPPSNG